MATSSAALQSFRRAGVVVFANSVSDWSLLPSGAKAVREKAGNTIPMVFVTSADGSTGIEGIPYATLKSDMREAIRDLRKSLETVDVLAGGDKPSEDKEVTAPELKSESENLAAAQEWINAEGKVITAAVKEVADGKIVFIMPDGREIPYPIANLSPESQDKVTELEEKG